MGRGITQGDPPSPMIFNIMVNTVVRATLQCGVGWVAGDRNLIFYADDGRIGGRDNICVQDALMVTVAMF